MSTKDSTSLHTKALNFSDDLSANVKAAAITVSGLLAGLVLGAMGYMFQFNRDDVIVGVAALALVVFASVVFAVVRAMIISAELEDDGTVLDAARHPLFAALFISLAIACGAFLSVVYRFAVL
ncbi:hypothetical protein AUR64_14885 [Haloprofundus marisrubri]|uniref:Uncharacterized protein n=1 Tax=Haloprofundus marisrubri TaxID=1514971 RepID=A0A0W1R6S7_9EURY|nr:hypothetical protein [Haloprofundus marisrubri]KTG09081.1 hypothetical protein AUR64_14885 [Haloprofundus marisrubri]